MSCDEDEATEVAALQGSHIHITTAYEYISITVIVIVKAKTPSYIKCPRQRRSRSGEVMRISPDGFFFILLAAVDSGRFLLELEGGLSGFIASCPSDLLVETAPAVSVRS